MQSFIFGVLFPAWFPGDASTKSILTQVALDIFFWGPCVAMPTVYSIKALFGENRTLSKQARQVRAKSKPKAFFSSIGLFGGPSRRSTFGSCRLIYESFSSPWFPSLDLPIVHLVLFSAETDNFNVNNGLLLPKMRRPYPFPYSPSLTRLNCNSPCCWRRVEPSCESTTVGSFCNVLSTLGARPSIQRGLSLDALNKQRFL